MTLLKVLSGAAVGTLLVASAAQAADLYVPETPAPIYEDAGVGFEGLYVGVTGGAAFTQDDGFGTFGVVAGVNFAVSDPIVAGVEVALDGVYIGDRDDDFGDDDEDLDDSDFIGNAAVRAHLGAMVTDNVMIYALAGVGTTFNGGDDDEDGGVGSMGYGEIGAGVEFGVTENVSIRGELAYLHGFEDEDTSAGRATAGVLFHF